jgi:hypothetical protein
LEKGGLRLILVARLAGNDFVMIFFSTKLEKWVQGFKGSRYKKKEASKDTGHRVRGVFMSGFDQAF